MDVDARRVFHQRGAGIVSPAGSQGFSASETLSRDCQEHYQKFGWVLIRDFFHYEDDILPIHTAINRLIDLKREQLGLDRSSDHDMPEIHKEDFLRLARADRERAGEIYRACRHLEPLQRLVTKSKCLEIARHFMHTDFVNILPYTAVRIDIPGEERYLFKWHQDYPYTQGSRDGVVVWVPLFNVMQGEGNIELIPGSHLEGIKRVELVDPDNKMRNGAHVIRIEDCDAYDERVRVAVDVCAGDALMFHALTVHRSTESKIDNIRWTVQLRYANFLNEDAVSRGWPGGMIEGRRFEEDHPEYTVPPAYRTEMP